MTKRSGNNTMMKKWLHEGYRVQYVREWLLFGLSLATYGTMIAGGWGASGAMRADALKLWSGGVTM